MTDRSLGERARRHAALGDPVRLAIVEDLVSSDRTSLELQERSGLASNSLAYHLEVLESAGLITRCQSSGDRTPLVRLLGAVRATPNAGRPRSGRSRRCSSARRIRRVHPWRRRCGDRSRRSRRRPPARIRLIESIAVPLPRAAGRAVDLSKARPQHLEDIDALPELVVTVCDRAHEELDPPPDWLHWSLPDPVEAGTRDAFDATVEELRDRITSLADTAA